MYVCMVFIFLIGYFFLILVCVVFFFLYLIKVLLKNRKKGRCMLVVGKMFLYLFIMLLLIFDYLLVFDFIYLRVYKDFFV